MDVKKISNSRTKAKQITNHRNINHLILFNAITNKEK